MSDAGREEFNVLAGQVAALTGSIAGVSTQIDDLYETTGKQDGEQTRRHDELRERLARIDGRFVGTEAAHAARFDQIDAAIRDQGNRLDGLDAAGRDLAEPARRIEATILDLRDYLGRGIQLPPDENPPEPG